MTRGRIAELKTHSKGCGVTFDIQHRKFQTDFSYESDKRLDRNCQKVASTLAANFALSYLPLDDTEFVCSDEEEFRLLSTLAYQSRMSYAYFTRQNKKVSNHLIDTQPRYSWRKVETNKVEAIQNPDSVLCFYSGGKDSTVSLKFWEAMGYSLLPLFIFLQKDKYRHTAEDALHLFQEAKRNFAGANTNIDELKYFFSEVTDLPVLEGTLRLYWVANALPLATGINAKFMSLSNELTLTDVVQYRNRKIFNNLFDQTFPATILVNRILKRKGLPILFSPVQGLTIYSIQNIISTRFPEEVAHQLSCNQPVYDEANKQWRCCSQCKKCHSLYLNVKALGLPPASVRLDEDKVLASRFKPEEIIGPDISRKELEHCLAMDNTYAPDYKGVSHPEVTGIQFSAEYHNPSLGLSHSEYNKFYRNLNNMLQGEVYLNKNGESKRSDLEEVWDTLCSYDYVFDGREARVIKKS